MKLWWKIRAARHWLRRSARGIGTEAVWGRPIGGLQLAAVVLANGGAS